MRLIKIAVLTAAFSLMAVPAFANPASAFAPDGSPTAEDNLGTGHVPEGTPTGAPEGTPSGSENPGTSHRPSRPEAQALGRDYCGEFKANFSENRSQFGKCVSAVAKSLRQGTNPRSTCDGLNRKPQEGERRSDFSACVEAAARALRDQEQSQAS